MTDNRAHNAMVHRVARRDGVDIDLCLAEGVTYAGEGARAIVQEESELGSDVHSNLALFSVLTTLPSPRPDVDGKIGGRFPRRMSQRHAPGGETGAASLKALRFRRAASTRLAGGTGNFFLGQGRLCW